MYNCYFIVISLLKLCDVLIDITTYSYIQNLLKQALTRNGSWYLLLLLGHLHMRGHSLVLNQVRLLRLILLPIRQRNVKPEDISFPISFISILVPPSLVHLGTMPPSMSR